jgi:hypothetical protein
MGEQNNGSYPPVNPNEGVGAYDKERDEVVAHATNDALNNAAEHRRRAENPFEQGAVVTIDGQEAGVTGALSPTKERETAALHKEYADWTGEMAGVRFDRQKAAETDYERDPARAEAIAHATNESLDSATKHELAAANPDTQAAVVSMDGKPLGVTGRADVAYHQDVAALKREYAEQTGEDAGDRYDRDKAA